MPGTRKAFVVATYNEVLQKIRTCYYYLLGKGGYVFGGVGLSVCLSVCLFVCGQHYSKSYGRIGMKL